MKNNYTLLAMILLVFSSLISTNLRAVDSHNECSDALDYTLVCPDDVTLHCGAELWDLDDYGQAEYWDGWDWYSAGQPTVTYNLNMCDVGTITRTWEIEDPNWNWLSCTQTITVTGAYGGFDDNDINWPADITLTGCDPETHPSSLPTANGYPTWGYADCSMIGVSYTDALYVVNANCKKILRTWTVLDWCQEGYDWYGNPTGQWTHVQKIKIINNDVPYVNCPDDIEVNADNCQNGEVNVPPLYVSSTSCGGDFTITNNSPYAYNNGADISGIYPVGWTTVTYSIKYGCGLIKKCTVKVHVKNNAGPTPYCYGSLTLVLMGIDNDNDGVNDEGMVELWAKDIDKGSYSQCGYGGPLKFSFSSDIYDDVKVFTCDEVGINYVDMWVTDQHGNQNYCTVKVDIQNNAANIQDCEPDYGNDDDDDDNDDDDDTQTTGLYDVGGKVTDASNAGVEGVTIDITEGSSDTTYFTNYIDTTEVITIDSFMQDDGTYGFLVTIDTVYQTEIDTLVTSFQMTQYSDEFGRYLFDSIAVDSALYTITATLDSAFLAEHKYDETKINAADLQFLMDFLLDERSFRDNAQRLAADINGDGAIDFTDLKLLYNYVVGNITEFPGEQWIIVAQEKLDSTTNIFAEEELNVIRRTIGSAHITNANFRLIRRADLVLSNNNLVVSGDEDAEQSAMEIMKDVNTMEELQLEQRSTVKEMAEISVSPNPFSEIINIEYRSEKVGQLITLEIYDVDGRLLDSERHTINTTTYIMSPEMKMHQSGIYVYRIIDGGKIHTGRLLKI